MTAEGDDPPGLIDRVLAWVWKPALFCALMGLASIFFVHPLLRRIEVPRDVSLICLEFQCLWFAASLVLSAFGFVGRCVQDWPPDWNFPIVIASFVLAVYSGLEYEITLCAR